MADSRQTKGFNALWAGSAAGLCESLITYPTEYVKTRQQLAHTRHGSSPLQILINVLRQPDGVRNLYAGAGAFCTSNAAKSGVRFFCFDAVRNALPRKTTTSKPKTSSTLLAATVAGVAESVLVVTPGETLKTKIIEDRKRPGGPLFSGSFDAMRQIVAGQGLSGVYKGVVPVTLKQSSNAVVRFTSYSIATDALNVAFPEAGASIRPAVAGALAGIVTVYITMPFDTIKTKMQTSRSGPAIGTIACFKNVVQGQGIRALWTGTSARLTRLTVSGAISFTIYDYTMKLLNAWQPTAQHPKQGAMA